MATTPRDPAIELEQGEPRAPNTVFSYSVTVRNLQLLPIRTLVWDHVFTDPDSRRVVARVRCRVDQKIKPGKTKRLEVFGTQPPSVLASLASLKSGDAPVAGETVEIIRIIFADNSIWRR